MTEDIAEELVSTLLQIEKLLQGDSFRYIVAHTLTYSCQVKRAIVDNRVEFRLEVVIPAHIVYVLKFEEVGGDHDIEDVLVVDLIYHVTLCVVVHLSKEGNDKFKGFQVARESDFNAFIVTNSFNDRFEVLYIV